MVGGLSMFSVEWRIGKSSKLQAPSSRKIPNSKAQNQRGKRVTTLVRVGRFTRLEMLVLVLGIWSFSGAWSLEFGAFSSAPLKASRNQPERGGFDITKL
jgi:hypothetical protein